MSRRPVNVNAADRMVYAISNLDISQSFPPFSGGAPDSAIDDVQHQIKLPIVGSYRTFIRELGDQNDFGVCGVNVKYEGAGTHWATTMMRDQFQILDYLLVVFTSESVDEALALDCRTETTDNEYPVYYFHPPNWQSTLRKIADSFVDWFEVHFETRSATVSASSRTSKKKKKK